MAGVAALAHGAAPGSSPAAVRSTIVGSASTGVVGSPGSGSPNALLQANLGSTPPPPPPPSGCGTAHTGSLSSGNVDYQPSSAGFSAPAGTHRACLRGPAGTDFDLRLQRRGTFGSWINVAASEGSTNIEEVSYNGSAGTYRWRVHAYSGSGSYTLNITRP